MWPHRENGRRRERRAFQPGMDGQLESRQLLSTVRAAAARAPHGLVHVQVANHGRIAEVFTQTGEKFDIILTGPGLVIASPLPGNRVKIVVNGTDQASTLEIDPTQRLRSKGTAHVFDGFPAPSSTQSGFLNVGSLTVNTGSIFQILAYKTANLSGPLLVPGTNTVDRIAFNALLPGASIQVGSPPPVSGASGQADLNTLDVFTNVNLDGGAGIVVGRDLNQINVGGTLNIQGGANIVVGRDIGLTPQPAKGSNPGGTGLGGFIQGDLIIGPESLWTVGRAVENSVVVLGNAGGDTRSRFLIPPGSPRGLIVVGDTV
jgi:hypothetical protein